MTQNAVEAAKAAGLVPAGEMKDKIIAMFDKTREGFEEFDPSQITIPRAKLLQGLSPEVQQNPKEFYAGMIINSITKEQLTLSFIPLKKFTTFARFNPRDNRDPNFNKDFAPGEMIWRSNDPNDPRVKEEAKWGANGEPPLATTFMNFLVYVEGSTMPVVLSFSRTSYTAGKNFYTMAVGYGGAMYGHKYQLEAVQETNSKGTFYVLGVRHAGACTPQETEVGKMLYDAFGASIQTLKIHDEEPEPGSEG